MTPLEDTIKRKSVKNPFSILSVHKYLLRPCNGTGTVAGARHTSWDVTVTGKGMRVLGAGVSRKMQPGR